MASRLCLILLGGFEARLASGTPLLLPNNKAQALLAYLAMAPGRAHLRDKLATLLWPGTGDEQARQSLRQALVTLRRALGAQPILFADHREVTSRSRNRRCWSPSSSSVPDLNPIPDRVASRDGPRCIQNLEVPMTDRIRVGIVGATVTQGGSGWGAHAHVPALKALPSYELKAVCTAHEDTAKASAAAFGVERGFHRFSEMAAHPEIVRLSSIGQTVQGRELWAMKITARPDVEEDEPELVYFAAIHGDEVVGKEICIGLINQLVGGYGSDGRLTALVDSAEIWIVPAVSGG